MRSAWRELRARGLLSGQLDEDSSEPGLTHEPKWVSDSVWVDGKRLELASGQVMERTTFGPVLVNPVYEATSAAVSSSTEDNYVDPRIRMKPYKVVARLSAFSLQVRWMDISTLDRRGRTHRMALMCWHGANLGRLHLGANQVYEVVDRRSA